jgi:hypothetical protein
MEEIDIDIRFRFYSTIKRIGVDYMVKPSRLPGVCGVWIHGDSGSGKTTSVDNQIPDHYPKMRNKWWDGYQGEDVVMLDDIDIYDVKLGGYLKHWLDYKPFICEIKNVARYIRPKWFIVTSQYKINEIWSDEKTQVAIMRRCIVIHKVKDFPIDLSGFK